MRPMLSRLKRWFSRGSWDRPAGADFDQALEELFERHATRAAEWYESGRFIMNGRNFAKDVFEALSYARSLVAEHHPSTPRAAGELLESHKPGFEASHDDPEGFGVGTLTDLINDLKAMSHDST